MKLEINTEVIENILNDELKNFPKEELHELCREAIKETLSKSEIVDGIFIDTHRQYDYIKKDPSDLLIKAAENFNLDPAFKDIQNEMIDLLKTKYKSILEDLLLKLYSDIIPFINNFKEELENTIRNCVLNR